MFSGLVETRGTIVDRHEQGPGLRLTIDAGSVADDVAIGDSIAVSGCCLTVVAIDGSRLDFEAGAETLSRTTLGQRQAGDGINLERSLRLSDRLGGHLVTGHVDGVGTLASRTDAGDWSDFVFEVPPRLARQMVEKGSVTVDGVSLTVVTATETSFSVALIPHTLAVTTLGGLSVGDSVHIETDLLAKYVERQLAGRV